MMDKIDKRNYDDLMIYAGELENTIDELRRHIQMLQKRWEDENNERIKLMGRYDALKAENIRLRDNYE